MVYAGLCIRRCLGGKLKAVCFEVLMLHDERNDEKVLKKR